MENTMILTLELTAEQEARLRQKANAIGVEPADYLIRTIDEARPEESLADRLARKGILGGVTGTPREDGRPWSQIEGFD